MKLWTVQPKTLYEELQKGTVIHCKPELSKNLADSDFKDAYDWMVTQMEQRIGPVPTGVKYPMWAWYILNGKNERPDLRRSEFRHYKEEQVCIELEVPDKEVLLSDECDWHMVLNNWYFQQGDEKNFDKEYKWFESLSAEEKEVAKRKSWEKIFDVFHENGVTARFVQATFWELRTEYIQNVRFFGRGGGKGISILKNLKESGSIF